MRILFLTQIVPWPLDAGPKLKTWNVLRYLHDKGHEILLATFVRHEEEKHIPMLDEVCKAVYAIPMRRSRVKDLLFYLRSHFSRRPFLIERDDMSEMRTLVKGFVNHGQIDVIHADQLSMVQFAFDTPYPQGNAISMSKNKTAENQKPILIFDAHNAVWTVVDRMYHNTAWFLKPIVALEAQRIKKYEGAVVRCFDHTLAVTEPDAVALRQAVNGGDGSNNEVDGKISIIPIAVDAQAFQPVNRRSDSLKILTLGTLHYPPNADGIRWFAGEVFPLVRAQIPGAQLTIVGKNPPMEIRRFAKESPQYIRVTGYVPDLNPYFEESALVVVPVRAGGGMRVRILETFARGVPIVTTTIGLEGIEAVPNIDVLVEDTPQSFADAVIRLLHDKTLQYTLAKNGRRLVEKKYDYRVVLGALNGIYGRCGSNSTHHNFGHK